MSSCYNLYLFLTIVRMEPNSNPRSSMPFVAIVLVLPIAIAIFFTSGNSSPATESTSEPVKTGFYLALETSN